MQTYIRGGEVVSFLGWIELGILRDVGWVGESTFCSRLLACLRLFREEQIRVLDGIDVKIMFSVGWMLVVGGVD